MDPLILYPFLNTSYNKWTNLIAMDVNDSLFRREANSIATR